MKRSKDYPNPATSGDGHVVLYDVAFSKKRALARIMAHELAHEKFRGLSESARNDYAYSVGWGSVPTERGRIFLPRDCCYVRPSGKTFLTEDFANNIEYFLFDRELLRSTTPRAHEWIQKHFGATFMLGGT